MKKLATLLCAIALTATASAQQDWAQFEKYEKQNATLLAQPADSQRVVFLGNSITQNWYEHRPAFFHDNNYTGRGISGQTSYQFLVRFRDDVINLHPRLVVINAGTNDIAQNNHRYVEDRTFGNIVSMCQLAQAEGIEVILTSVLPCGGFPWNRNIQDVPGKIRSLNARIKAYAEANGLTYVDYWTPMAQPNGAMKTPYTYDGCHPTKAGYAVMEPLIKAAIQQALK